MGLVIMIVLVLQAIVGIFRPSNKLASEEEDANDNDDEALQAAKPHEDTDGEHSNATDSNDSQTQKPQDSSNDSDDGDNNPNKARVAWEVSHAQAGRLYSPHCRLVASAKWDRTGQRGIQFTGLYSSILDLCWCCLAILVLVTVYMKVQMVQ